MSDFDRLYGRFQKLAGSLEAQLTASERLAALAGTFPRDQDELRAELALHEEALQVAAERRAALAQRREQASGLHARADRERCDALLAEIDREVPLLEYALQVLRERLASNSSPTS